MTQTPTQIQVSKPKIFTPHYQFRQNEKELAVLDYEKRWGKNAVLHVNDKQFKLKTTGFWKQFIHITAEQSPYLKLSIPFKWTYKMAVSLNNRQTYHFKSVDFWNRVWAWYDEKDNMVVELRSNQFSKQNRGQLTIHQPATDDLLLLAALGWYTVMAYEEQSAG